MSAPERENFARIDDQEHPMQVHLNLKKSTPTAVKELLLMQIMSIQPREILIIGDGTRSLLIDADALRKMKYYCRVDQDLAPGQKEVRDKILMEISEQMRNAKEVTIRVLLTNSKLDHAFENFINNNPNTDLPAYTINNKHSTYANKKPSALPSQKPHPLNSKTPKPSIPPELPKSVVELIANDPNLEGVDGITRESIAELENPFRKFVNEELETSLD